MIASRAILDIRGEWQRPHGVPVRVMLVDEPGQRTYLRIDGKHGFVCVAADEMTDFASVVRRCSELVNGHPKNRRMG